ncbi:MAG TPA: hypothetical protein VK451_04530 [Methyloceanibacter sp.]|nr:hypothetical protein [Methyloceanibacter sp.]
MSKIGKNGKVVKSVKSARKAKPTNDVDKYLKDAAGLDTAREQLIGQHIGYRYDVNLVPDYARLTPYLKAYMEFMGWDDLNWLEDVHMGYEAGQPAIFDRNINGWVRIPKEMKLPDNQQDRDMLARELLVRFQTSPKHPLNDLNKAYRKF